jgi:hypothetical protein
MEAIGRRNGGCLGMTKKTSCKAAMFAAFGLKHEYR